MRKSVAFAKAFSKLIDETKQSRSRKTTPNSKEDLPNPQDSDKKCKRISVKKQKFSKTRKEIILDQMFTVLAGGDMFHIPQFQCEEIVRKIVIEASKRFSGESKANKILEEFLTLFVFVEDMNYIEIATHIKKSNFSIKELWKLSSKPESYLEELENEIKKEIEQENYSQTSNIFKSYSAISDITSTHMDDVKNLGDNTFSLGKRDSPEDDNIDDFLVTSKTVKKKKKSFSRVSKTNSASGGNEDNRLINSDQKTRKTSPFKSPIKLDYQIKNIDWDCELRDSGFNEETSTVKKELSGGNSAQRAP